MTKNEVCLHRPWLSSGRSFIIKNHRPVFAPKGVKAVYTKEEWIAIDQAVARGAYKAMPTMDKLFGLGFGLRISDTMPSTTFSSNTEPAPDGSFGVVCLPLPSTYVDFDPNGILANETAGTAIGVKLERTLLGTGKSNIYGFMNHPRRIVRDGASLLTMIQHLKDIKHYGPYGLIVHEDVKKAKEDQFMAVEGIHCVIGSELIDRADSILVQLIADVVRLVIGLELVVIQWEGRLRAIAIIVPQIRCDCDNNTGVLVCKNQLEIP